MECLAVVAARIVATLAARTWSHTFSVAAHTCVSRGLLTYRLERPNTHASFGCVLRFTYEATGRRVLRCAEFRSGGFAWALRYSDMAQRRHTVGDTRVRDRPRKSQGVLFARL